MRSWPVTLLVAVVTALVCGLTVLPFVLVRAAEQPARTDSPVQGTIYIQFIDDYDGWLPQGDPEDEEKEGNSFSLFVWRDVGGIGAKVTVSLAPTHYRGVCTNWGTTAYPD